MKRTKTQKGITLIALIITIVVLLILASVAISSIQNDGILHYAENAAGAYNNASKNEQTVFDNYLEHLEGSAKILDKDGNDVRNKKVTSNTEAYDKFGNKIVIPAGFMIRVDASTNNADNVTEGIVIEDCTEAATKGSQFVWIPVGKIYTDIARTESKTKTINLGRYDYVDFKRTDGVYTPAQAAENYSTPTKIRSAIEQVSATHTNAAALDLGAFITSSTTKGGYYIGRYEAGIIGYDANNITTNSISSSGTRYVAKEGEKLELVCKAGEQGWNYVSQVKAAKLSREMYGDGYSSGTYSSDLTNSYAFDTAIIFIQTFSTDSIGVEYYKCDKYYIDVSGGFKKTGTNGDVYCNINDLSGNFGEYSTEFYDNSMYCAVARSHYAEAEDLFGNAATHKRANVWPDRTYERYSFRPIIYLAL